MKLLEELNAHLSEGQVAILTVLLEAQALDKAKYDKSTALVEIYAQQCVQMAGKSSDDYMIDWQSKKLTPKPTA